MFTAAVFPAMAREPKELMELWMSTLEMEKEQPWMPAGRPMRAMPHSLSFFRHRLFRSTW